MKLLRDWLNGEVFIHVHSQYELDKICPIYTCSSAYSEENYCVTIYESEYPYIIVDEDDSLNAYCKPVDDIQVVDFEDFIKEYDNFIRELRYGTFVTVNNRKGILTVDHFDEYDHTVCVSGCHYLLEEVELVDF